jgi:YHS domain-containing protein
MSRVVLFLLVLFLILLVLRALRIFLARLAARTGGGPAIHGEMVRDPVCGTWIDRRLAIAGRRGGEWLPVCSEKCREKLEEARPSA